MTRCRFYIGGKFIKTTSEWLYVGGTVMEEIIDVDQVSFFTILDKCAEFGYKKISKLWYDEPCVGLGLRETLKEISGDNTFNHFFNYVLDNSLVNIYVEHSDLKHPYFDVQNPKTLCDKLGISDHGQRFGEPVEEFNSGLGGGSGVNNDRGKSVVDNVDNDSEFDGYETEHGVSEYECDDNDPVGIEYWMDLSDNENKELLMAREKKKRFKKRGEKKITNGEGSESKEGSDLDRGPLDDVGPSGVSGFEVRKKREGNASERFNIDENAEELVEEIRREMGRRAEVQTNEVVEEINEVSFESDKEGSFLTSSSDSEAEHSRRVPYRRPRFKTGEKIPEFSVCMVFPNKSEFKKAVVRHAIHFRRDVRFTQNEKIRCRGVCKNSECEWRILCSIDGRSKQWMVKTYVGHHSCQKQFHISCLNYKILAEWFRENLRKVTLKLSLMELKNHFNGQTKIKVSKTQCRHAKQKVIEHYIGDPLKEFARLEDYVEELKRSNPGSTVVLEAPNGVFKRMYVCFDGVRKGFNTACRKLIGLDGCFLKGPFKGEILAAVGRDPNDQIYPIAWAVVGYEEKETWKWFLDLLMVDLDVAGGNYLYASDGAPVIARGEGFTFMSDQQKGLLSAINELMPSAVSRRCARHIFAKWRKEHNGEAFQIQFWRTCRPSTTPEFLDELEVLKGMVVTGPKAMADFLEVPPIFWCRAFQNTSCCSDVLDNNMCETFNSLIIESRYKSIVKLFETIRKIVFKRFKERRNFIEKFKDGFGPNIWKKINHNMEESGNYYVDSNGDDGFEVHLDEDKSWIVSLEKSTCTCRLWELTGIPCAHALCVIVNESHLDVRCFVSKWYNREMFEMAYKNPIKPVNCKKYWPRVALTLIRPPAFVKFPGRPKKLRRKESWEPTHGGIKMSQKGRKMSCTFCRKFGHKLNTCPNKPLNQHAAIPIHQQPVDPVHQQPVDEQVQPRVDGVETSQDTSKKRSRTYNCSFCKLDGHIRDMCVLNPTSKRFINPANRVSTEQVQPSQVQASQLSAGLAHASQVQASQLSITPIPDRTQQLLQELRQSCGTAGANKGKKKMSAKNKGKLSRGLGCFVAQSGWTCYDPKTSQQRVIDVPKGRKTMDVTRRGEILEDHRARVRVDNEILGSQGSNAESEAPTN